MNAVNLFLNLIACGLFVFFALSDTGGQRLFDFVMIGGNIAGAVCAAIALGKEGR